MIWKDGDLEKIPCDLCGSTSVRRVYTRPDGLNIAECSRCNLCFVCPRPKAHLTQNLYEKDYFDKSDVRPKLGYADYTSDMKREVWVKTSQVRLDVLREITGIDITKFERFLEIGCATGEFCQVLSQKGVSIVGCDASEFAIAVAKERYPSLDFRVGGIDTFRNDERFDAVFAFEVIEHVPSPKVFLHQVRQHLNKNGILVISTPNYQCGKTIGLDHWLGFSMSFEHIYFLTPTILIRYAKEQKMSVVDWFTGGGNGMSPDYSKKNNASREYVKGILDAINLLSFVRQTKSRLIRKTHGYRRHGNLHTLFIVFRAY